MNINYSTIATMNNVDAANYVVSEVHRTLDMVSQSFKNLATPEGRIFEDDELGFHTNDQDKLNIRNCLADSFKDALPDMVENANYTHQLFDYCHFNNITMEGTNATIAGLSTYSIRSFYQMVAASSLFCFGSTLNTTEVATEEAYGRQTITSPYVMLDATYSQMMNHRDEVNISAAIRRNFSGLINEDEASNIISKISDTLQSTESSQYCKMLAFELLITCPIIDHTILSRELVNIMQLVDETYRTSLNDLPYMLDQFVSVHPSKHELVRNSIGLVIDDIITPGTQSYKLSKIICPDALGLIERMKPEEYRPQVIPGF